MSECLRGRSNGRASNHPAALIELNHGWTTHIGAFEVHETFPAIDPVDGSMWLSRYERNFGAQTILRASRTPEGWSAPNVVGFSGQWGDRAPRFSPDGGRLYFTSNRPTDGGSTPGDRTSGWSSEDKNLGAPINSDEYE